MAQRHSPKQPGGGLERLDDTCVLILEADPRSANVLATVLEYCGATVMTLVSPGAALSFLGSVIPQVVVVATSTPGSDDGSLLRALRERARGAPIPALALSADPDQSARASALAAGFQACLIKPVDVREFCRAIRHLAGSPSQPGSFLES